MAEHRNSDRLRKYSGRTTMTTATNNEIRLRVDNTTRLSLQLSGDIEGRTLQLVPAEGGMTDLAIGGNVRSGETLPRSKRGRISRNLNNNDDDDNNNNQSSIVAGQRRLRVPRTNTPVNDPESVIESEAAEKEVAQTEAPSDKI
jgi:hypothetical protein